MLKKILLLPGWQQVFVIILGFLLAAAPIVAPIFVIAQQYDTYQPINTFPFNYWLLNFMEILGFVIVTVAVQTIEHAIDTPSQRMPFFRMIRKRLFWSLSSIFVLIVVVGIFNGDFMGVSLPLLIAVLGILILMPILDDLGYIEVKKTPKS